MSYFCTVGFGLDCFAVQELASINAEIEQILVGKVFFIKDCKQEELLLLKTVERLFVKVLHCEVPSSIPSITTLEDWLKSKFLTPSLDIGPIIDIWKVITSNYHNSDQPLSFRVNSRLSGRFKLSSNYRKISSCVSLLLISLNPQLAVNLHEPQFEVFLHLNDCFLSVGLQITKKPLSDRSYLKHIAVRSTVCCALAIAVGLKKEDILLDPMCGAATILIEAVKQFNCATAFGIDCDPAQLKLALANLETSSTHNQINLILGDSRGSLLRNDSWCDVILCDVPFGRKFGRPNEIKQLLSDLVLNAEVVLKPAGRLGILISEQLRQTLIDLIPPHLTLLCQYPLRLGTLPAAIVVWRK